MLTEQSDFINRPEHTSGAMEIEQVGNIQDRSRGKPKCADRFIPSFVKKSFYDTYENEENIQSDSKKSQFNTMLKKSMFFDNSKNEDYQMFSQFPNKNRVQKKLFYFSSTA